MLKFLNENRSFPADPVACSDVACRCGAGRWAAAFTFMWDKKPHVWNGTVKGQLDNGNVSGDVAAEGGGRTFQINGQAGNHVITFSLNSDSRILNT